MWYIVVILIVFCIIMLLRNKRADKKEETPPSNDAEILSRKKELGAIVGIGLKNLSGFNISVDYLCGIYLFQDKIYFESKSLFLEIPIKYFLRVYTESLSDNSFFRTYKPKLPQFTLKIPSAQKLEPEEVSIEEHRLVFEVKGSNDLSEHLVFAFGNDQFQTVKRFVECCDEFRKKAASEKDMPG